MEVGRLMEVQFILDRSGSKQDFTDSIARGGGDTHMKKTGMLVVSLRGVNLA